MTGRHVGSVVAGGLCVAGLVPADSHEAYRRGLCRDCFVAQYSPGRTRCASCHGVYAVSGPVAAQAAGAARRAAWIEGHVGVEA